MYRQVVSYIINYATTRSIRTVLIVPGRNGGGETFYEVQLWVLRTVSQENISWLSTFVDLYQRL